MPGPDIADITVQRGDDDSKIISFFVEATGVALLLSDLLDVWFTVRQDWARTQANDADAVFSASLLGTGITPYGTSAVLLELPSGSTRNWIEERYAYDVQVRTIAGKIITTQKGFVVMGPDVSRSG